MKKYILNDEIVTLPYTYVNEDGNVVTTASEEYLYSIGAVDYVKEIPLPVVYTDEELLKLMKIAKIAEINVYDTSEAVNSFTYNSVPMWIDKATRVGLMNAVECAINLGLEDITFGMSGISVTMSCNQAKTILSKIELYALDCYNTTLAHKNEVYAITDIDELNDYDITKDYPSKLIF